MVLKAGTVITVEAPKTAAASFDFLDEFEDFEECSEASF